jgi:NAD(P)-dependent dehydrogenase (short-subunit alcohol dehydrogenase family)
LPQRSGHALGSRRAVVSGAAGGIGSAIVQRLIEQGAVVHGLDRDAGGLERLAAQFAGRFQAHAVELANRADCDRMLNELASSLGGRCDILVNGAGVSRLRPFDESDDALLDEQLAVNFVAVFRLTRALLPALRRGAASCIINIASELALVGQAGYTAYCATKGAVLAWSRALAVELAGESIRVNAVCPGPIDTPMLAAEFATWTDPREARRIELATIPLNRLGAPGDIAAIVAFLASDDAAFVTGAAWSADGGKTAR